MKRQTRKLLLNVATGLAVATVAAVVFLPAAQAAPGQVTGNVNVRSGPGASYRVIDTLQRGTNVDVRQCQANYCEVRTRGTTGWVSASYLTKSGGNFGPGPGFGGNGNGGGIGITIGPNGPSINFGNTNPPPRPPVVQANAEVCFYDRTSFRGRSICAEEGESIRNLGDFSERISSIDNPDGLRVEVCGSGYRDCRTYTSSASSLDDFDDYIVSVRVR